MAPAAGLPCSDLAAAEVGDHGRLEGMATKRMAAMLGMAAIGLRIRSS
jgi:hypothetical protein